MSWVAFFFLFSATLSGRLNEVYPYFRLTLYLVYCLKIQRSSENHLSSINKGGWVERFDSVIVGCNVDTEGNGELEKWRPSSPRLSALWLHDDEGPVTCEVYIFWGRTSETPSKLQETHSLYHRLPQNPKMCQRTCWSLPAYFVVGFLEATDSYSILPSFPFLYSLLSLLTLYLSVRALVLSISSPRRSV